MLAGFAPPPSDLAPFVERFWWCSTKPGEWTSLPLLAPGVGYELFLHRGTPFVADSRPAPVAHLFSARTRPVDFAPQVNVDAVVVRFRAGALRHFVAGPVNQVAEGVLDAEAFWPDVADLREEICTASHRHVQVETLVLWCRGWLATRLRPDGCIDHALATLYDAPGEVSLDAVVRVTGLGPRQFQRRFKAIVGTGPKRFHRLTRFYKLVRRQALLSQETYLPAALDLGYYDQAHVIHEFRDLTGRAPCAFLRELGQRTHFYNPSRRPSHTLVSATQGGRSECATSS